MPSTLRRAFIPLLFALMVAAPAVALEVEITVENLTPANGGVLTPVWVGFHDGGFDIYDLGAPASAALERIAEDGNAQPLSDDFTAAGNGAVQGLVFGPDAPVIFPGQTGSLRLTVDESAMASRYFSYASMVIPSNDAFVATANPNAHPVFDGFGNFVGADFMIYGHRVRDAGTEVNDEAPANTAFFGQAAPDTGVVEGGVITVHPGLRPVADGGILAAPDFANADFTRPGYAVARVRVRALRPTTVRFPLSGGQEVPAVTTDASGVCTGTLNRAQTRFELECSHDVEGVAAAHIHQGDRGTNGPVVFDLGDPTSPIRRTWEVGAAEVAALLAGELYVNVHSADFPNGEVRGQIDTCFAGPDSLCLNEGRFQVEATFISPLDPQPGTGRSITLTEDSGLFYFFEADNAELLVKVLDACDFGDRYWVYVGATTDVEVELTVTDTLAGVSRTYRNEQGMPFVPIRDTNAFATCP